ncbi:MAG: alpha/beta hydrolase [Myxococcaceae bacterium]
MKRRLKRLAVGFAALVGLLLCVGLAWEAFTRGQLVTRFPVPGTLVDVGGHRLQLDCRGEGEPTVVFESGIDTGGALAWSKVHDAVAKVTRACAYSRAGLMWSEPSADVRDAKHIADELHALLAKAGVARPVVLVGHSLGGVFAMTFTAQYPEEVAGVVLVDASHPEMKQRMNAAGLELHEPLLPLQIARALARTGVVRVVVGDEDAEAAFVPGSLGAMVSEIEAADTSLAQASALRGFGDRPLFVLTAGKLSDEFAAQAQLSPQQSAVFQQQWRKLQDEQASWSTRSQHVVVADTAHDIHRDRPEEVIAAVKWVVAKVRER